MSNIIGENDKYYFIEINGLYKTSKTTFINKSYVKDNKFYCSTSGFHRHLSIDLEIILPISFYTGEINTITAEPFLFKKINKIGFVIIMGIPKDNPLYKFKGIEKEFSFIKDCPNIYIECKVHVHEYIFEEISIDDLIEPHKHNRGIIPQKWNIDHPMHGGSFSPR